MSVLAGMMIAIGCILYLQIGGVAGALFFAVGLASICFFDLKLFTGQAGKLVTGDIDWLTLGKIWIGNFCGVIAMMLILMGHNGADGISQQAMAIMAQREQTGYFGSLLMGIPCGMLMYCAVSAHNNMRLAYIMLCVAAFILGGFYHCVADMFYTVMGAVSLKQAANLIFVTGGNIIGCNLIPFVKRYC